MKLPANSYQQIIEEVDNYALLLLDENGNIEKWNSGAEKLKGYKPEEIIGRHFRVFYTPEDQDKQLPELLLREAAENGRVVTEGWRVRKNRTRFWNKVVITALYDRKGKITGFTKATYDLTDKKQAEKKIEYTNRLYAFITQINQAIVKIRNEKELLTEACRIATETGKFDLAWFGIPDEATRTINLIAQHNATPADIAFFSNLRCDHDGPTATIMRTGKFFVINDFEKEKAGHNAKRYADDRGFKSFISFPVEKSGKIAGTYNLFSTSPHLFDQQEIAMLKEISDDLSFALNVIEKEKEKKRIEEKIIHNEIHLKRAQEIAHFGSWEIDFSTGIAKWSEEACRIYGLDPTDNIQTFNSWISHIHPEDREYVLTYTKEKEKSLANFDFHYRIIRNGEVRHVYSEVRFEFDNEKQPLGLYGIMHDITRQKVAEEKLTNANRLYAFISEINQAIVRETNESGIFKEVCRIATGVGKFNIAWIGTVDCDNKKINIVEGSGIAEEDIRLFTNAPYASDGPQDRVIKTGAYYVYNNLESEFHLKSWKSYIASHHLKSVMVLPIKKGGNIYATLNLYSSKINLFDDEEILLLNKVANDISFALDVFEKEQHRKQMEQKILHNELRLKQAQAIAHFGNWELDFASGVAQWSEEACRIYGLDAQDNIHTFKNWLSFIHPDDLPEVLTTIDAGAQTLDGISFFHRIVHRNGVVRHLFSEAYYELDRAGKPVGMYGVAHDITDTKNAQDALAQSEKNLRLIMDLIPQSIFAKDLDGKYLFVNKSYADLYGLTPKELIEKSIKEVTPVKIDPKYFPEQDHEVILSGQTKIILEDTHTDSKGNERLFHTVKVPFIEPGTNRKAVLGVTTDITEQKRIDEERTKMIADITQRNKDLEQFSYILSHNLRAPVANILGLAELMGMDGSEKPEDAELVNDLTAAAKKLDDIIMDLNLILQVKPMASRKKETIKFSKILESVESQLSAEIRTAQAKIISDFSAINQIDTYKSYFHSIFLNLVSNGIKFRQPEINPVIEISSLQVNNKIQLIFKDHGLGLDLDKKSDQIFGLYKRFHEKTEGKGIGLFMVKKQVESLGGKISISSKINHGTEFRIEFDINK